MVATPGRRGRGSGRPPPRRPRRRGLGRSTRRHRARSRSEAVPRMAASPFRCSRSTVQTPSPGATHHSPGASPACRCTEPVAPSPGGSTKWSRNSSMPSIAEIRVDGARPARRQLGVPAVHRGLLGHPPLHERDVLLLRPGPHRRGRIGRRQHLVHAGQPVPVPGQQVLVVGPGRLLVVVGARGPPVHDEGPEPVHLAQVVHEVGLRPAGAVGDRSGERPLGRLRERLAVPQDRLEVPLGGQRRCHLCIQAEIGAPRSAYRSRSRQFRRWVRMTTLDASPDAGRSGALGRAPVVRVDGVRRLLRARSRRWPG